MARHHPACRLRTSAARSPTSGATGGRHGRGVLLSSGPNMAWLPTGIAADGQGPHAPRGVSLYGRDLFVALWEGGWYAVEDRCSHAGCAFSEDAEVDGPRIVCNCHGSEFDLRTGQPVHGPAIRPVRTFPTRVTEGVLEVEL